MEQIQDTLVLSPHRKTTWQRCKLKEHFHYTLRMRKPRGDDMNFAFGEAIHAALEVYYKANRDIAFENVLAAFKASMEKCQDSILVSHQLPSWQELGKTMLSLYYNTTLQAETFTVLAVEQPFKLPINDCGEVGGDAYCYIAGKIDLVARTPGGNVYIIDHKTTSQQEEAFLEMYDYDEQLLAYSVYGRHVYGDSFTGVMVNGLNKRLGGKEPPIFRRWMHYTPFEIDGAIEAFLDAAQEYYTLRQTHRLMLQRQIQFDCRKCEYFDPCMAMRKGENWGQILELFYENIEQFDWEE